MTVEGKELASLFRAADNRREFDAACRLFAMKHGKDQLQAALRIGKVHFVENSTK
jgi:hypothetical protein